MYQPIACRLYDYVEIACLRHYNVRLELIDGCVVSGRAVTTRILSGAEYLVCEQQPERAESKSKGANDTQNSQTIDIRLDRILAFTPLDKNAEFGRVLLQTSEQPDG